MKKLVFENKYKTAVSWFGKLQQIKAHQLYTDLGLNQQH